MAQIYFGVNSQDITLGSIFEIGVFLDTQGQPIAAVESLLYLPPTLELVDIRDGNSVMNLWLERPAPTPLSSENISISGSGIKFSGMTPAGFKGDQGELMTLVVKAVAEGQGAVEAMNSQLLLNDGQGTPDEVLLAPLGLSVVAEGEVTTYQEPVDLDPPETFTPLIAYDDDLGGWVVVFATQDKISGIAGYQVKEGWGFWHTASSPWVLHDQGRHSVIKVRALDRVGNVREVELAATNPQNFYETPIFWGILLAVLAVAAVIFQVRRLWRLKRRKS